MKTATHDFVDQLTDEHFCKPFITLHMICTDVYPYDRKFTIIQFDKNKRLQLISIELLNVKHHM